VGYFTAGSQNVIHHSAEDIYDFVSNPHNWPKTYKGSAGMIGVTSVPIKIGESWTEQIKVGKDGFECRSTWKLIIAERPRKWAIQQVDRIGELPDGSGGVNGITTITYTFEPAGEGATLFTRTLTCELPKGTRIPDPLLVARAQPAGIDGYHDAVAAELDKEAEARRQNSAS
jgi:hypothetical protein